MVNYMSSLLMLLNLPSSLHLWHRYNKGMLGSL